MQKEQIFEGTLFLDTPATSEERKGRRRTRTFSPSISPPSGPEEGRAERKGRPRRRAPFSRSTSPPTPTSSPPATEHYNIPPSPSSPAPPGGPRESLERAADAADSESVRGGRMGRGGGAGLGAEFAGDDVDAEDGQALFLPFGIYSGTPGVPHPHHVVDDELKLLENPEDASWCFMCSMRPADVEMIEWQELVNHIETLGSRELTCILKDVQRSYNLHFKDSCEGRVWTLRSIEEHIFHHGGASEQAHAREQRRQFAMLRHYVAENNCLQYDLSTKRVVPNTEGIAQVIKLAKLEQNLQNTSQR